MTYKISIVAQETKWAAGEKQLQGIDRVCLFFVFPGRHYVWQW